jgi:hypothetical protein
VHQSFFCLIDSFAMATTTKVKTHLEFEDLWGVVNTITNTQPMLINDQNLTRLIRKPS